MYLARKHRNRKEKKGGGSKEEEEEEEAGVVTVSEPEHEWVCLLEGTWGDQCSADVSSDRIRIV